MIKLKTKKKQLKNEIEVRRIIKWKSFKNKSSIRCKQFLLNSKNKSNHYSINTKIIPINKMKDNLSLFVKVTYKYFFSKIKYTKFLNISRNYHAFIENNNFNN